MHEISDIDFLYFFLFWLLTCLLSNRIGWMKGKAIATKMIRSNIKKVLSIGLVIALASCSAPRPAMMSYIGQVVMIQGCEVCVSYGNVDENDGSKSLGCFAHYEGHSYGVGDKYPDQAKHTSGIPVVCVTP